MGLESGLNFVETGSALIQRYEKNGEVGRGRLGCCGNTWGLSAFCKCCSEVGLIFDADWSLSGGAGVDRWVQGWESLWEHGFRGLEGLEVGFSGKYGVRVLKKYCNNS